MGDIGINGWYLAWGLLNFGLLLGILYVVGYKPILKMFGERSDRIKESMDRAEAIKEEQAKTEETVRTQLEEARRGGDRILASAEQVGERLREEAKERAKREAEALVESARTEIERERDAAIEGLRREFADLTILAAERVIRESLDKKAHQKLIDEILESTSFKGKG
jgi:F-type H+-transporting ATPase subunit b